MANRLYLPALQAFDPVNGEIMPGAKLFFYIEETSTPKDTYSDADLTIPNANPVEADSGGFFGDIFLAATGNYKIVLKDADDNTVWTRDNYAAFAGASAATQADVDARTATNLFISPAYVAGGLGLQGASIASATALTLPAIGDYFSVTGTTQVESISTRTAGRVVRLKFDGALVLKYNASSLILPGAADITTAAGDVAELVSEGSGNWRCTDYTRATGRPVVGGGMDLIALLTASSSADLRTLAITSTTYDTFVLEVRDLLPATDDVDLYFQVSTDAGTNWKTSGYLCTSTYAIGVSTASAAATGHVLLSRASATGNLGNDAGAGWSGTIKFQPRGTSGKKINAIGSYRTAGNAWATIVAGGSWDGGSDAVTGVRLITSSGNIASGSAALYGLRNA